MIEPNRAEWRCPKCRRLLCKVKLGLGGSIEIVCEKCGAINLREVDAGG